MVHVVSEQGGTQGKDYCVLYNPQWAHLPQDLAKAVSTTGWLNGSWRTSAVKENLRGSLPAQGMGVGGV